MHTKQIIWKTAQEVNLKGEKMKDTLIIKTEALIPKEKMKELHTDFVEQLKTGVVIIPAYFEAKLIHTPDDVEVIVKCEEKKENNNEY